MKIAVDAMGGDHAPGAIISGSIAAVNENSNIEIVLVGDEAKIKPVLDSFKYPRERITLHHAPDVIQMRESPATSVRRKRKSSIVIGLNLVKDGGADAFFSAGNTGAVVCAATLSLGLLSGIERPGIAIVTPTIKGASLIIDVGANIDAKPMQLLQYGIMGAAYAKNILNKPNPTVGLLNVGEEDSKGTGFVKETYELLTKSDLNFIGNIEGKAMFSGKCDVIVCDGFVGNIALKVTEGTAEAIQFFLKRHLINSSFLGKIGILLLRNSFRKFKKELDYAEFGGAPLLGLSKAVIIGHGRSNAKAIKNAVRVANEEVESGVNQQILEALKASPLESQKPIQ